MLLNKIELIVIIVFLFAEYALILEGKVAIYRKGYHVLRRRLQYVTKERKKLKKEVTRLENLLFDFAFL
jgi:hypothetical protein